MYKEFFGLEANPFNVNPDPHYLVLTPHAEEALSCLTYGIQSRKGFVLLTGEVGTGKTTLVNKLLSWLRAQHTPHTLVVNTQLNVPQFFEYMLSGFGLAVDHQSKSRTIIQFYHWLLDRHHAGETPVVIVDEAQNLSDRVLEEIRLLTNLETFTDKLLQIVLVGQPELEATLRLPELRQLRQRVALRTRTYPLSMDETRAYIAERLHIAGSDGRRIFDARSLEVIYRRSGGIQRLVNLICEHCLINAFIEDKNVVTPKIVEFVVRDQDLDFAGSQALSEPRASADLFDSQSTIDHRLPKD